MIWSLENKIKTREGLYFEILIISNWKCNFKDSYLAIRLNNLSFYLIRFFAKLLVLP